MRAPRRHHGAVVDIGGKFYTASDGTPDFVYREVVRSKGGWKLKATGAKGTLKELVNRDEDDH